MDPVTWFWKLMSSLWIWFWPIVGNILHWCITPSVIWWLMVGILFVIGFFGSMLSEYQFKGGEIMRFIRRLLASIGMGIASPVAMFFGAVAAPSIVFFAFWFDTLIFAGALIAFYGYPIWWIFFR